MPPTLTPCRGRNQQIFHILPGLLISILGSSMIRIRAHVYWGWPTATRVKVISKEYELHISKKHHSNFVMHMYACIRHLRASAHALREFPTIPGLRSRDKDGQKDKKFPRYKRQRLSCMKIWNMIRLHNYMYFRIYSLHYHAPPIAS